MDTKKIVAEKAISLVQKKQVVGLGASSAMPYLVEALAARKDNLELQLLTSSFVTQQLLLEKGLQVGSLQNYSALDIYFDGCDQFDKDLNAVKSGGGIHTREKLLASMATQFVLLGDETKRTERFDIKFPLVLEVLPEAFRYVEEKIKMIFTGTSITMRMSDKKIGPALTDNGNYLLDCWFTEWPQPGTIYERVKLITGVIETSLFYRLARIALMPGDDYQISMLTPRYSANKIP